MVVYQGANVSLLCMTFRRVIQNNILHLHIAMRDEFNFFYCGSLHSEIGNVTSFFPVVVSELVHQLLIPGNVTPWGKSFVIVYRPVSLCGCIKISFVDAEHFPTHFKYTHTHIHTVHIRKKLTKIYCPSATECHMSYSGEHHMN